METKQCPKCGKATWVSSATKCSACGLEFPLPRTVDDEREDRIFDEGKKSESEPKEMEMEEEMKRPLKAPPDKPRR
jgi:hypothetical protein